MLRSFRFPGNWNLDMNEETAYFKLYFVHPETGKEALYSIEPGERRHLSLPVWQPLVHEVAKADGTIGLVCPLVTKYNDQWYVAVMRNQRHAGERVEVARKAWDNPSNLPPEPSSVLSTPYDLGYGDANTARIIGGQIKLQIVILSGLTKLVDLPGKVFWMKAETFAERHSDMMGAATIGKAFMLGIMK